MIRSICCCGPGSSSIKPDSVRGVILAIVKTPFSWDAGRCPGCTAGRKMIKRSRPAALGRERLPLRGATQIQGLIEPPLCLLCYGEGAVGVSAPAPPLSFLQAGRARSQPVRPSLWRPAIASTAAASARCMSTGFIVCDFSGKSQAMGRLDGIDDAAPVQIAPGQAQHQHLRRGQIAGKGDVVLVAQPGDVGTCSSSRASLCGVVEEEHHVDLVIGDPRADLLAAAVGIGQEAVDTGRPVASATMWPVVLVA